jgi:hypothetical protein
MGGSAPTFALPEVGREAKPSGQQAQKLPREAQESRIRPKASVAPEAAGGWKARAYQREPCR